jgi:cytoplasmic iron level regulating protein YaaA (DUF328/UPF0246 family)
VKNKLEKNGIMDMPQMWRQFERKGQTHSCKFFPLEEHFKGKDRGKALYEKFKDAIKNRLGDFKIESLECCIHFVSTFTFAAVKIFKDKIVVDFSLERNLGTERAQKNIQFSAHRYLYYITVKNENEIDDELIEWIWEAYCKNK